MGEKRRPCPTLLSVAGFFDVPGRFLLVSGFILRVKMVPFLRENPLTNSETGITAGTTDDMRVPGGVHRVYREACTPGGSYLGILGGIYTREVHPPGYQGGIYTQVYPPREAGWHIHQVYPPREAGWAIYHLYTTQGGRLGYIHPYTHPGRQAGLYTVIHTPREAGWAIHTRVYLPRETRGTYKHHPGIPQG